MPRARALFIGLLVTIAAGPLAAGSASAAPVAEGKEWRELYPTTGLTWGQVATVCPRDGATPCSGSAGGKDLTGWVWATSGQVRNLLDDYAPELATTEPPALSGPAYFFPAITFLGDMRWTTFTSLTYFYSEWTGGWTASTDAAGVPVGAGIGYSHALTGTTATGEIGLGSVPDVASPYRGVFLWRPVGGDYTAPVVTPDVAGTLGSNGWYRSDVSVSWTVSDPESAIVSTHGCDAIVVTTDTPGETRTCTATSAGLGGPGSATVTIKRDSIGPTITCDATPTFELTQFPAYVSASASDATSGTASSSVLSLVSTTIAGPRAVTISAGDRAGNTGSGTCPYNVVVPTCNGRVPTIVGTAGNDVITGTAGNDVILGLSGADTIDGLGGDDTICGGDNPDLIRGGAGADTILGGPGNDDLYGGSGDDDINGGEHSDSIRGDAGADRCTSGEIRMSSCAVIY